MCFFRHSAFFLLYKSSMCILSVFTNNMFDRVGLIDYPCYQKHPKSTCPRVRPANLSWIIESATEERRYSSTTFDASSEAVFFYWRRFSRKYVHTFSLAATPSIRTMGGGFREHSKHGSIWMSNKLEDEFIVYDIITTWTAMNILWMSCGCIRFVRIQEHFGFFRRKLG